MITCEDCGESVDGSISMFQMNPFDGHDEKIYLCGWCCSLRAKQMAMIEDAEKKEIERILEAE